MSLFAELKRRKVVKVGAAYLVVAWVAVQVVSIAFPAFDAPPWAMRVFILLCLLGFPATLALAWAFESTPDGLRRDASTTGNKRMAMMIAGFAVLALGWYFIGMPSLRPGQKVVADSATAPAASAPVAPVVPDKSIAVLAFADMSPNKDNEFLGDGIAEEILNGLAHVPGLKVAGRTSSFHFKGRNEDLKSIGAALQVAHVLEGSVRRQGDKVRITAQLIRSSDGFHLWSETFDGDMQDVFALQERIARAVTDQLQVVLGAGGAAPLVRAGTQDPEAYALYLEASQIFNRRQGARFPEGMAKLQQAIARDPKYARAWARLASMHALSSNYRSVSTDQVLAAVEAAAAKASALDPRLGEPYAATGLALDQSRSHKASRAAFEKALALEPDDITANTWNGITLVQTGYVREGSRYLDRALALDPLLPIALLWRAGIHLADGDVDTARRQLQLAEEGNLSFVGISRSELERRLGHTEKAADYLDRTFAVLGTEFDAPVRRTFARACAGDASARPEARAALDRYLAARPNPVAGTAVYVLFCLGDYPRALEWLAKGPTSNDAMSMSALMRGAWSQAFDAAGFADAVRAIGLAELWELHGPPDRCTRQANGDWRCH